MESTCLEREFGTVESDAEKEMGKDKRHGARDYDACNAGGEATDAGLKLDCKVPCIYCEYVIGSRMAQC